MGLVNYGDAALEQCEICPAGTSTVSMFSGKSQADLSFSGDAAVLRHTDVYSRRSRKIPAYSMSPHGEWRVFESPRLDICGSPECIQIDEAAEWQREIRTDV